jgi:hypothetical protein
VSCRARTLPTGKPRKWSFPTETWVLSGGNRRIAPGSEAIGDQLEQMPTLRDAVFSGMTLDTFNRHLEKVASSLRAVDQLSE